MGPFHILNPLYLRVVEQPTDTLCKSILEASSLVKQVRAK
jgi:hypothetical protein